MVDAKCSICKEKPVFNKKRKLCKKCYGREYQKLYYEKIVEYQKNYREKTKVEKPLKQTREKTHTGLKFNNKSSDIFNANELEFIENFFKHDDWIHHPCTFRLGKMSYTPDFYDKQRNIFIEVTGTRQAFHQNKLKYLLLAHEFPGIKFEIRKVNGLILRTDQKQLDWSKYCKSTSDAK